jgi:curved DNA-binding protein CbpA
MVSKRCDRAPAGNSAKILGIADDASTEEIRAAYLKKVKEYPPDRYPEEFEAIRDAYTLLGNPKKKLQLTVLGADPHAPFPSLLDSFSSQKEFVGPDAWLDVLREDENDGIK